MYVNDGVLFACARNWEEISETLTANYTNCVDWLTRSGLAVEPDKTKLLFFKRQHEHTDPPMVIHLWIPSHSTYYHVKAAMNIQYLGFYINHKLNWPRHVEIMCNQAWASLKFLQILGNSICGINFAQWRMVYNAVCLPVLTYGCQLWFTGKQVSLVLKLQRVQNEVVWIISGSFSTALCNPLHQILSILPMSLCLDMLTLNYALRLYRLPRDSQLLKCLQDPWSVVTKNDLPPPTPNQSMAKMALRWLASQVHPDGPCILAFPPTPQDCLCWQGQVAIHPGCPNPETQPKASVFCLGILTSTGSPSSCPRGAAAAVLQLDGAVWGATAICLGKTVTKFNAQLAAFQPALALTNLFLWESNYTREVLILNNMKVAVPKAVDTRPGPDLSLPRV